MHGVRCQNEWGWTPLPSELLAPRLVTLIAWGHASSSDILLFPSSLFAKTQTCLWSSLPNLPHLSWFLLTCGSQRLYLHPTLIPETNSWPHLKGLSDWVTVIIYPKCVDIKTPRALPSWPGIAIRESRKDSVRCLIKVSLKSTPKNTVIREHTQESGQEATSLLNYLLSYGSQPVDAGHADSGKIFMWVLMDVWPGKSACCHLFFLLIRQSYTCQTALRSTQQLRPGIWSEQGTWLQPSVPVLSLLPAGSTPPRVSAPPSVPSQKRLDDFKVSVILWYCDSDSQMHFPDLPSRCHWFITELFFLAFWKRSWNSSILGFLFPLIQFL